VVIDEHDHQRDPLGDRGHEFAGEHQIRAVTDHHEHLTIGRR
jgi:hypothetical protein